MMSCGREWAQVLDYGASGQNLVALCPQPECRRPTPRGRRPRPVAATAGVRTGMRAGAEGGARPGTLASGHFIGTATRALHARGFAG